METFLIPFACNFFLLNTFAHPNQFSLQVKYQCYIFSLKLLLCLIDILYITSHLPSVHLQFISKGFLQPVFSLSLPFFHFFFSSLVSLPNYHERNLRLLFCLLLPVNLVCQGVLNPTVSLSASVILAVLTQSCSFSSVSGDLWAYSKGSQHQPWERDLVPG